MERLIQPHSSTGRHVAARRTFQMFTLFPTNCQLPQFSQTFGPPNCLLGISAHTDLGIRRAPRFDLCIHEMMNSKQKRQLHLQHRPRLERRNAIKNIDYYAGDDGGGGSGFTSPSSSDDRSVHKTRSLDLVPLSDRTSFRMEGIEGEADQIFRYLGLNPEDLSIPVAAWEARKSLSPSSEFRAARNGDLRIRVGDGEIEVEDIVGVNLDGAQFDVDVDREFEVKSKLIGSGGLGVAGIRPSKSAPTAAIRRSIEENDHRVGARTKNGDCEAEDGTGLVLDNNNIREDERSENQVRLRIRVSRPPNLAPPPVLSRSLVDQTSSTWDILRGFGPEESESPGHAISSPIQRVEESGEVERRSNNLRQEVREDVGGNERRFLESRSDSPNHEAGGSSMGFISENDHTISPSGSFSSITSWQKGDFLGSGSFGTVYEGFTE